MATAPFEELRGYLKDAGLVVPKQVSSLEEFADLLRSWRSTLDIVLKQIGAGDDDGDDSPDDGSDGMTQEEMMDRLCEAPGAAQFSTANDSRVRRMAKRIVDAQEAYNRRPNTTRNPFA